MGVGGREVPAACTGSSSGRTGMRVAEASTVREKHGTAETGGARRYRRTNAEKARVRASVRRKVCVCEDMAHRYCLREAEVKKYECVRHGCV